MTAFTNTPDVIEWGVTFSLNVDTKHQYAIMQWATPYGLFTTLNNFTSSGSEKQTTFAVDIISWNVLLAKLSPWIISANILTCSPCSCSKEINDQREREREKVADVPCQRKTAAQRGNEVWRDKLKRQKFVASYRHFEKILHNTERQEYMLIVNCFKF